MDGQLSEQYNLASYLISIVDHNLCLPFVNVYFYTEQLGMMCKSKFSVKEKVCLQRFTQVKF